MDFIYSSSLLISLLAGSAGALIGVLALLGSKAGRSLIGAGLSAVALALLALVISVVVHWQWGHGPTSASPMNAADFVGAHTAFLVSGVIIVVGLVVLLYVRQRQRAT